MKEMKSSIKKLGVATGVFLIATAMSPAFNSSHAILQNLGSTTVEASSSATYTTKANLNLRSGASTKHKALVTIPKGKEVTYIVKTGSWSKVKYGSKIGYVSSSYIQKATGKITVAKKTVPKATVKISASVINYKTKTNLNLRSGASTKYKTLVTIPKNKEVTYVSKSGSWYKVKYGSKTGYVSSSYLTKVTTKVTTKAPSPKVSKTATPVKTYTVTANLNLRKGASTKYSTLLSIPKGKAVTYISKSGSWSKVKYGSKTGYVSSKYLKAVVPKSAPKIASTPSKPVVEPVVKAPQTPKAPPIQTTKGQININSTKYGISLNEMVEKQYSLRAQTDAYRSLQAYVAKSSVTKTGTSGILKQTSSVVASDGSFVYGTLPINSKVTIIGETKTHHQISYQAWRNAKSEDIKPNVDPTQFSKDSSQYFQFLDLSASANVTATELNKVLNGKGILNNQGNAFVEAGKQHGVNEVYLLSHALLETGQGNSQLATGVLVDTVNGQPVTPKVVYNMFGIGAYDATALKSGSERAYLEGWTTPEKAIIGGAKFIGNMYVNHPTYKQNTLYKMRWNPERPGSHQYATDIGWAVKQTTSISNLYKALDDYSLTFDVPVYR